MKAKIYVGAKKYALYIGRKIVQKTLEFLTLPARFVSKKAQDLKNYLIYGNSKQSILPDGYTRLQYIESTTNQYIDTGVKGELGSELTFKGQLTKYNTAQDYGHLWGDLQNNTMAITFNPPSTTTKTASSRFGNKYVSSNTSPVKTIPLNTPVTIIQNKDGATTTTGFEITFGATIEFTTVNSLLLFSTMTETGASTITHKWRCEYYSHKKNNVLVQEFIPCKNPQGEIGMYDTISGNFFGSESDTPFVAGDDYVPTPDTPIEIESVGDKTKNLFNKTSIVFEQYMTSSGTYAKSYSGLTASDYIEVEEGKSYTVSGEVTQDNTMAFNWFDNNKAIMTVRPTKSYTTRYITWSNIAPIGAKYLIVNIVTNSTQMGDTWQIKEGSVATPYEPYGYKVPVVIGDITTNIYLNEPLRKVGEV